MAITLTGVRVRGWLAARVRPQVLSGPLYLLPGLLIIVGVILYPVVFAFVLSVQDVVLSRPGSPYVGLDNYRRLLLSLPFWRSIGRGCVFTLGSLVPQVALGLGMASLLNYPRLRARTAYRALIVLPWLVPTVTVAIIWRWMFHDLYGVINHVLLAAGLLDRPVAWLADPVFAMGAVIIANVWRALPLMVVLFLAGLQSIPGELYEAALVDGASIWQRYVYVILPLLAPIIWIAAVLRTIWTFNFFDLPWIMTQGGPADATTTPPIYAYLITFSGYRLSQGAAVTVAMFGVLLIFAAVYFRLSPGRRDEQAA